MTNAVQNVHRFFYFSTVLLAPAAVVDVAGNVVGRGVGDVRTVVVVALAVALAHLVVEVVWRKQAAPEVKRRFKAPTQVALFAAVVLSASILSALIL